MEDEKEKPQLIKAIEQLNRIIYKQEFGVADNASPVNASEIPTPEDLKSEKTGIEMCIDQLELKIDDLLSRNSPDTKTKASYALIAQNASASPAPAQIIPCQPLVPRQKYQAINHTTLFVVIKSYEVDMGSGLRRSV